MKPGHKPFLQRLSADAPLLFILIAMVVLMALLLPGRFLASYNLVNLANQLPVLALLSIGMMVSMLSGGINLAIVAAANFTGIVTALTMDWLTGGAAATAGLPVILLSMAVGLAACMVIALLTGFLIAWLEIPPILATLGVMMLLDGLSIVMTRGYTLSGFPPFVVEIGNGSLFWAIPNAFVILVLVILALHFVLNRSPFGFKLYMLGANPRAAEYSNIDTRMVLMKQYALSFLLAALTGFIMMGQFNSVKANYAESYVLVTVLACFLGGINPFGGDGRLSGIVLAAVILQTISSGVNLLGVDPFFVTAMWGAIILIVIAVSHLTGRHSIQAMIRALGLGRDKAAARPETKE
ncbi:MAG: ABC transporter permease [Rhodobacteraceae bacterium]|jgi:ribose/xylose/arabinose/galactoside ABC-type transport system permease subunit|nr:ABC transporter permease [Paracoccaceae bacterium]